MIEKRFNSELLQRVFQNTQILRKPITGIISGYHTLPYILVGPDENSDKNCIEIQGKINVSPRFIISPHFTESTYGEIFKQENEELMDKQIFARVFSFIYTNKYNVKLENTKLEINKRSIGPKEQLDKVVDKLNKEEIINTGVIFTPVTKLYPISIDRFINDILEKEFGA